MNKTNQITRIYQTLLDDLNGPKNIVSSMKDLLYHLRIHFDFAILIQHPEISKINDFDTLSNEIQNDMLKEYKKLKRKVNKNTKKKNKRKNKEEEKEEIKEEKNNDEELYLIEETLKKEIVEEMNLNIVNYLRDNKYTRTKINAFLNDNKTNIQLAADEMYNDYKNDNELNDLKTREGDWVREYLFKYVELPPEIM